MRFLSFLSWFTASLLLVVSCTTSSLKPIEKTSLEGSFSAAGLKDIKVNSLNAFKDSIYASTDYGLYEQTPGIVPWVSRGLQQDSVLNVMFLPDNKLLAAIRIADFSQGIPSLFLSTNQGVSWKSYMSNFGGPTGKYTWVESMTTPSQPSDTLYTQASGGAIARSIDGGNHWKMVNQTWDTWGGFGRFIFVDPYSKKNVWAGGSNAIFQPILYHSKDGGNTWHYSNLVSTAGESTIYDLLLKQGNSDHILIVIGYGLLKSTDGGENWHDSWNVQQYGVNTLTHSARDPQVVYASGQNATGTLFFAASTDFGDTWQTIDMPDTPTGIYVNDMVSVMQDSHEVLYFGTNKGVYSYTFKQ